MAVDNMGPEPWVFTFLKKSLNLCAKLPLETQQNIYGDLEALTPRACAHRFRPSISFNCTGPIPTGRGQTEALGMATSPEETLG